MRNIQDINENSDGVKMKHNFKEKLLRRVKSAFSLPSILG